ncbi:hypothetical protein BS47DRAFT_510325 [Hydnum rufescens UP504]|uniref:Snf7-domain-containing protein n=1 Tax=Hydnum rufescens UP504 TaxID=1448309 RepID=A0A9P6B4Z3_9AGAM|nr:hypothetical protein BS47DRAFT_510325 [Hydnum rufescens UP504]
MGNSSSTPKITTQDRAILDLKLQRDKLKQYQKKIQYVLDREQAIARESLATGNRTRALTALRRRKYQEGLLLKTDTQLETLQILVSTIEFSLVEKDIIYGLKQGNEVLTEIHKEMSLEGVEKLMEETADAIEYQKEINQILQSRMTHDEEDAVQRELETMQRETVPTDARVPHLPVVPSTEPDDAMPVLEPESNFPNTPPVERLPVAA